MGIAVLFEVSTDGQRALEEGLIQHFKGSPAVFDCWPPPFPEPFPGLSDTMLLVPLLPLMSSLSPLLLWPWNSGVLRAGPHPFSCSLLLGLIHFLRLRYQLSPSPLKAISGSGTSWHLTVGHLFACSQWPLLWARHLCWALGVRQVKQACPVSGTCLLARPSTRPGCKCVRV